MLQSRVQRFPDLARLEIPERQTQLQVRDDVIFADIKNQRRGIQDRVGGAAAGDYVLVEATDANGHVRKLHIELGSKFHPEIQAAVLGKEAGQQGSCTVSGMPMTVSLLSVRQPVEFALTDASIAAMGIPGVQSLADYRIRYIQNHGKEIAAKVFSALQRKLMDDVVRQMAVQLNENEVERYQRQQQQMIQNISGNWRERIFHAYGGEESKSQEECEERFYRDNLRNFVLYVWGRTMAEQNGRVPTMEENSQAVQFFCMIFNKEIDEVRQGGLEDDALQPFYLQYGIGLIRAHYFSRVRFCAAGIPPQPLTRQEQTK